MGARRRRKDVSEDGTDIYFPKIKKEEEDRLG
jgi:hypothetical protein